MSVLVYVELSEGSFKKKSFEAVNYAAKTAQTFGGEVIAMVAGNVGDDIAKELGQYGADKVVVATNDALSTFNAQNYAQAIEAVAQAQGAKTIILPFDIAGKAIAPVLSAKLKAGLISGAVDFPVDDAGFTAKKTVFSGKAFAYVRIKSEYKIVAFVPNSHAVEHIEKSAAVEQYTDAPNANNNIVKESEDVIKGEVPLSEAELVVSGGRGMKGPENWGILEDLANSIGATLACSRPVADAHWRPHHEHVGQTGGTIRPNLYLACGISGAIQHLAGVNNSKTIVVINKDPEAPFFKAADYGVVGDIFEVVPKLTEAFKNYKG